MITALAGGAVLLFATGCGEEKLEGFVWSVIATADADHGFDECNDPGVGSIAQFDYRLTFDGSYVELAIGPDTFATGSISGCAIVYETVVWGEPREGFDIRWQMEGSATYRIGGDACNLPPGIDWKGEEIWTIVKSDDPRLAVGCRYGTEVEGNFAGQLE